MKQIALIFVCLVAGAVGGVFATLAIMPRNDQRVHDVVRARRFELIDQTGKPVSYWGIDDQKQAVLAFGLEQTKEAAERVREAVVNGLQEYSEPRASIGSRVDGSPFMRLAAADGTSRVRMYLSGHDKPLLLLEDNHRVRVSLGIDEGDTDNPNADDWNLEFHPDRARIGMHAERDGGQEYLRGFVITKEDPVKFP